MTLNLKNKIKSKMKTSQGLSDHSFGVENK
jgi:hypothetical protein